MKFFTNIARVLIALVFILSGLLKANDPTGFGFKLTEYFEVFHLSALNPAAFTIACLVSILEILIGYAMLMGIKPKLTAWSTFVMMLFFWLLVGFSAITGKVSDCGCFGDAVKFSLKQEFINDSIFLLLIILILAGLKHIKPLIGGAIGMVGFIVVLFLSMGFTIKNYLYLPAKDFLPFKIGNSIQQNMVSYDPDVYENIFIYTYLPTGADSSVNEARLKEIYHEGVDSLYKYKDRITKKIHEGAKAPIHDFIITDKEKNDATQTFFANDYKLVLTSYDLKKSNKGAFKKLAVLSNDWRKTGKDFWGLTNSLEAETESLRHDYQLFIDFYNLDGTPIKMMVRSNPGLLLIKKDVVIKKWSSYNIPSIEEVNKLLK
ncbi:MAG: DoxX family protein [Bacteroidetes bacterium]|nr:DoxX family protein [Bacteroidota bacterium]